MGKQLNPTAVTVAKILVGLGVVGFLIWKTPILDIFIAFGVIVGIPVLFAMGLFMSTAGIYDLFTTGQIRDEIDEAYEALREAAKTQNTNKTAEV